jgi:hypothetical protein
MNSFTDRIAGIKAENMLRGWKKLYPKDSSEL